MIRIGTVGSVSRIAIAASLAMLLLSCAGEKGLIPGPILSGDRPTRSTASTPAPGATERAGSQIAEIPKPPPMKLSSGKDAPQAAAPAGPPEEANITMAFDQLPLPTFIQTVYGSILKKNFTVDPAVAARTDLVTLRTGKPQTPTDVAATAKMLLKSYGIAVLDLGGFLKLSPDTNIQGYSPEIRRGRALPEAPLPMRPIFYLVELKAVKGTDVSGWLRTMFPNKLTTLVDDSNRNAIMLGGLSEDVIAAMEAIEILDQPLMKARTGARFNPVFWGSDDFARKLTETLTTEGYFASTGGTSAAAIIVLPVQPINAVLIFAGDDALLKHTLDWAQELDKPNAKRGATMSYFIYQVRYTDANELAKTVSGILGAAIGGPAGGPAGGSLLPDPGMTAAERIRQQQQAQATPPQASTTVRNSRVVVNPATNSIIFQGTGEEYVQILNLLKDLDRPAKTALIEVTVAEVGLTNNENLGIEWALKDTTAAGALTNVATLGGLSIGGAGLLVRRLNNAGDTRLVLNALASNNRARILSSPRIVARSGETATIQVGAQVPIITSQQTTPTTGSGSILQSVQYLPTGVILTVKPIIYSADRIDIEVSQEVSSAQATSTGVSSSPTINTRKVQTKLAMRDGATVLLGGLMSSNETTGNSGIPLLKDIPVVGQFFRVDANTVVKTELVVLITPYVINDDIDAQSIADAFRGKLGNWAQPAGSVKDKFSVPSGSWLDLIRLPQNQEVR